MLRMFRMRIIYLLIVTSFCSASIRAQGSIDGFYKKKTEFNAVVGIGFEDSKKYLAGDRKLDLERSVYYAAIFTAYGISEKLQVQASVPYIVSDDNRNLQDVSIFLKYNAAKINIADGKLEFSAAGGFSTPISNYAIGGLNDIGQRATAFTALAMVHYQNAEGWFATAQSGFALKLQEVPNSLPITFKAGRATSNWYYDVFYDFQKSFGGIDYRGTPAPQNFRNFGVDFHNVGGTLYRPFSDNLGMYVSVAYTFEGRNTFLGATYGIGLSYTADFMQ